MFSVEEFISGFCEWCATNPWIRSRPGSGLMRKAQSDAEANENTASDPLVGFDEGLMRDNEIS
jgi:hypothetical protein